MITRAGIRGYLKAEPFRPFRIHMPSGRTFAIRHPEAINVGGSSSVIASLASGDQSAPDKWYTVSFMLVEFISHLDDTTA
jgi:hypothetical protein